MVGAQPVGGANADGEVGLPILGRKTEGAPAIGTGMLCVGGASGDSLSDEMDGDEGALVVSMSIAEDILRRAEEGGG